MAKPLGIPDEPWREDPDPTVVVPAWPELETAMRERGPGESDPVPSEHVLVVYAGSNLGRVFPLVPGPNVIGRSPGVGVPLVDEEVSRVHACLTLPGGTEAGELVLEDRGSTNGTFVNNIALTGPVRVRSGDRITIGGHVLKLVAMDPLERAFYTLLLDQSTRDPLTGLNNRRTALEELQTRFDLSQRHQRPLSVLMVDLDHFKRINDTLGHGAGDRVLEQFGQRVRASLRNTDLAGRIGGEEFLLVLPETEMSGARFLAERLLNATGRTPFDLGPEHLNVTCSIGVAQRLPEDRDGGSLLARADGALYDAKRAGRNRIQPNPMEP
jgi:diguanylate cyclase (GGDEF)-like protein